jgi:chromosome segregation ATPase
MEVKVEELEDIKEKIDELKSKKTKSQGALEQLLSQLKEEFGVTTVEAAQEKQDKLSQDIERDKTRRDSLLKELEEITDWEDL